ncbi:LacI family DNA-binding transcriptional regulator [Secundilactobacillus kimchicus]|uniref:LacI family DNA-binding transcriptional regulator n=1 Tax=Secundilactobacillus kimchicus TaxID=528209 RepID=UPI0012E37A0F|nr:LacI family DNA-binding transcriptional regulator [Secundilactobacillus kimchicus]MBT9672698.1 LacI family DNA-binding transcriptional regulator [Secundilactobacillus kimchicus]
MENATIMTIAKLAKVSHTTVSRALNGSNLVKEETREKIRAIAKEIGYTPNISARGLVNRKTFLIGVFFSEMESGTSPSFLVDVLNQAREALPTGYIVSVDSIGNYKGNALPVGRYDGVVIISQAESDDVFIDQVRDQHIPMVVLNRQLSREDIVNYATDDYLGAQLLIQYAARMGHERIGILEGHPKFSSTKERWRGYVDSLNKAGLQFNDQWVKVGDYLPKSGYDKMKELLSGSAVPSCVFVTNDDMAVGAIRACEDLGFRVPDDISILGFDDTEYSKYLVPRLTTIKKPTHALVRKGIVALTNLLSAKNVTNRTETLRPSLVIRESVANVRNETN